MGLLLAVLLGCAVECDDIDGAVCEGEIDELMWSVDGGPCEVGGGLEVVIPADALWDAYLCGHLDGSGTYRCDPAPDVYEVPGYPADPDARTVVVQCRDWLPWMDTDRGIEAEVRWLE